MSNIKRARGIKNAIFAFILVFTVLGFLILAMRANGV